MLRYAALFIFFIVISHQAQALRCGNEVIVEGDRQDKLLKYCGKPAQKINAKIAGYKFTNSKQRAKKVKKIEKWFYNFGANDLYYIVYLEKGRVVAIETDGYGFNQE